MGHGDLKDKPWWQKMQTRQELVEASVTLIWIASALHAAVNFGQYPYRGLILNRPTISRISWVKWADICTPKIDGGVGIKDHVHIQCNLEG